MIRVAASRHRPETMQEAVGRDRTRRRRCRPCFGGQLAQPEPAAHAGEEQATGRPTLFDPSVLTLSCAAAACASRTRRARPEAGAGARCHPGRAAGKLTCGILSGRVRCAGEVVVVDQPPLVIQTKVSVVVDPWSALHLGFRTCELRGLLWPPRPRAVRSPHGGQGARSQAWPRSAVPRSHRSRPA